MTNILIEWDSDTIVTGRFCHLSFSSGNFVVLVYPVHTSVVSLGKFVFCDIGLFQ